MKTLLYIIIFLVLIISYIHIIYHTNTSSKMEVYDIDYTNVHNLNEICDLRQPFTFRCHENSIPITKEIIINNNSKINIINKEEKEDRTFILSHNNYSLVKTPYVQDQIINYEDFVKPSFNVTSIHDIIIGDENFKTELLYEFNYRNFFHVTEGEIIIRLLPPKFSKSISHNTDYEVLQEKSSYNIWEDSNKVKHIEIKVQPNDTIFIPPYWFYSFHFVKPTTLICFKYRTFMNSVTILPQLIYSFFTIHNKKKEYRIKNQKKKKKIKKKVTFNEQ